MLAELARETANRAVGPRRIVLVRAKVVQNQKAHRVFERRLGRKNRQAAIQLLEHARADFGVTEKMHFAVGRDAARFHFADVVKERSPTNLELRNRLTHDLLRVLPHVFVSPLAVAESDHRLDFGKERFERAAFEQRVQTRFGIVAHDDAIEARAQGFAVDACELDVIFHCGAHDRAAGFPFGNRRSALERVHRGGSGMMHCGGAYHVLTVVARRGEHDHTDARLGMKKLSFCFLDGLRSACGGADQSTLVSDSGDTVDQSSPLDASQPQDAGSGRDHRSDRRFSARRSVDRRRRHGRRSGEAATRFANSMRQHDVQRADATLLLPRRRARHVHVRRGLRERLHAQDDVPINCSNAENCASEGEPGFICCANPVAPPNPNTTCGNSTSPHRSIAPRRAMALASSSSGAAFRIRIVSQEHAESVCSLPGYDICK